MIAALLFACGGPPAPEPRPPGVPDGAAFLRYSGNELMLDATTVGPWTELNAGALDQPYEPLVHALEARLVKEAGTWIALPANATWAEGRRAVHTVFEAEADPLWFGPVGGTEAWGPLDNRPPSRPILSCPAGPLELKGFAGRLTIELHADEKQTWANGHVRFKPKVVLPADGDAPAAEVVAELLPLSCWRPTSCDVLADPALIAACREGAASSEAVPDRVEVAGSKGCLVPLATQGDHTAWRAELKASLTGLGLGPDAGAMLMADENVALGAMFAVFGGLGDLGIGNPQLGMLRMGSGDPVPLCDTPLRDRSALDLAGARWLGQQLGTLGSP